MAGTDGLNGDFVNRLNQLMQACNGISITSGYRSPEYQAQLFRAAVQKYGSEAAARKWVAPPGKSNHGKGIAADIGGNLTCAHRNAGRFGLHFPMDWEPWHIEPVGGQVEGGRAIAVQEGYTDPPNGQPRKTSYVDVLNGMLDGSQDFEPSGYSQDITGQSDFSEDVTGKSEFSEDVVGPSAHRPDVLEMPDAPQPAPATQQQGGAAASGGGSVKEQMKAGFRRAGREDLAAMVDTPEFHKWIQQESSWRDLTSAANNQGKPNYGYFQFWAGHSWARPGIPADQQAFLAATKFNLTPERIRGFAAQIQRGTYKGWG